MSDANDPFSFDAEYGDPDFVRSAKDPNRLAPTGQGVGAQRPRQRRSDRARRRSGSVTVRRHRRCAATRRRTLSEQRHLHPKSNGDIHQGRDRKRDAPRRHDAATARRAHQVSDRHQQDGSCLGSSWRCSETRRSEKNSLRTNANTLQISGVEVEHDLGEISFGTAPATILKAQIRFAALDVAIPRSR